jgi:flagellar hook assembly protein FlgD
MPGGHIISDPPYPNPFSTSTTLSFALSEPQRVRVGVYDQTGKLIKRLISETLLGSGHHRVTWDGTIGPDIQVAAGVYLAVVEYREGRFATPVVFAP